MPLVPALPPERVPVLSGFDYVTVDVEHRRVLAAHTGSQALLIVDADTGKIIGQVRVGPLHGVAVDPSNGHVYTGNGTAGTVSEIDPATLTVVRSADVAGDVDAIAYDAGNGRIYADENDGTRVFVIDAKTMKSIGTVALPGHKPEYLAVDPKSHEIFQNIADLSEVAVIDPQSLMVKRTFGTPLIAHNHPLQFDTTYDHVLVGGQNGLLADYDVTGKLLGSVAIQARVDQCSLDQLSHRIACAGSAMLTLAQDNPNGTPTIVAQTAINSAAHTVGIDPRTGNVWIVWSTVDGDFTQSFSVSP